MSSETVTEGPLTRAMALSRHTALRDLRQAIESRPPESREDFGDMMQAAFREGGLDPRNMSDDMGYSFSSVYRWVDQRSAPHPSAWPTVASWITKRIGLMLDETATQTEGTA